MTASLSPQAPDSDTTSACLTRLPLSYQKDSLNLFRNLRQLALPVWLDSGAHQGFEDGRFDILSADPIEVIKTFGKETSTQTLDTHSSEYLTKNSTSSNPFDAVSAALSQLPSIDEPELPFTGGAMGFFGYHLNQHLEKLPAVKDKDLSLPDMQVGIYDWAIIQDHQQHQGWLVFLPSVDQERRRGIQQRIAQAAPNQDSNNFYINELGSNHQVESYREIIAKIQAYIRAGDVYQVNFAQRFIAKYQGDPFSAYQLLRQALPAPYSGFMELEHGAILSHSPELFIQLDGQQVCTKPIKGTRPRGEDPLSDQRNIASLIASPKDRAENLMIVDLLRNDLGKHCVPGSISAPDLFSLRSFKNVHHLVSTVTGTLRPNSTAIQLLRDSFPGGSITGAPKVRAMQIINELEQQERSAYCGSLGYISCNGKMTTNVAIRTLVANGESIVAWGGGGIVADSDADAEYRECLDKIGILLRALPRKP